MLFLLPHFPAARGQGRGPEPLWFTGRPSGFLAGFLGGPHERPCFQPPSLPGPLWRRVWKLVSPQETPPPRSPPDYQPARVRDLATDLNCPPSPPPPGQLLFIPQNPAVFSLLPGRLLGCQACLWGLLWAPTVPPPPSATQQPPGNTIPQTGVRQHGLSFNCDLGRAP